MLLNLFRPQVSDPFCTQLRDVEPEECTRLAAGQVRYTSPVNVPVLTTIPEAGVLEANRGATTLPPGIESTQVNIALDSSFLQAL